MKDRIARHCSELAKCNQRGERMLSLVDLVRAETLSLDLAAFLLHRVSSGDSFVIGANPGGAGKTTIMCALVNAIPGDHSIIHADSMAAIELGGELSPACYICHEIGQARFYAYLWGQELAAFYGLGQHGHMLASNLHADTYDQALAQVCGDAGVEESLFDSVNLYLFIKQRHGKRLIKDIWYSADGQPHQKIECSAQEDLFKESLMAGARQDYRSFLEQMDREDTYTIEGFRGALLEFRGEQ